MTLDHDQPRPRRVPSPSRPPGSRRVGALATVGVLIALLAGVGPAAGQAGFDCDDPVIDTSGLLDRDAVIDALDGIDDDQIGPDAVVIVRVWDRAPGADLVAAVDELVVACFGDVEGGIDDEVAVLSTSTADRALDVLLGARWAQVVDAERLQAEVMTPLLADGDVTGAFVRALGDMAVAVSGVAPEGGSEPVGTDQTTTSVPPVEPDPAGGDDEPSSATDPPASTSPTASSGDGRDGLSAGALALGALGLGGCGAAFVAVRWRRELARDRARMNRLIGPTTSRLLLLRDRHARLQEAADGWYLTTSGRTRTALAAEVRQAKIAGDAMERAASVVRNALPGGPDAADRTTLARARELVNDLIRAQADHDERLDGLEALGSHLDHLRVALPAKAELLVREVPDVREAANRRAGEGWNVEQARVELSQVQATVDEVREAASGFEADLLALSDELEAAEASLFRADHEIETLPGREQSLTLWLDRLTAASHHESDRIVQLRSQLATTARVHAPASWRWAADHPEKAAEAIERSAELQVDVADELLPAQRYDEAGRALEQAGLELMVADDHLDEVDDLLIDLERALADAPRALDQVRRAVTELGTFLQRHRDDVGPDVQRRRVALQDLVAALDDELLGAKPNYRLVVETAEELSAEIDELLVLAEEQHQAAEAMRRELRRHVDRAERALARARRSLGWELFPSADGRLLDQLEGDLASLPDEFPAASERAAAIAEAALRVQEQIIARRRRRGTGVSSGAGPAVSGRSGWTIGGGSAGSRSSSGPGPIRSRGGRSFGGRPRAGGGRSTGSRRSSGRY